MIILCLGAGIQSSTILLMSCRAELPKIDHAIFADTGWEPQLVYEQLEWLKKEANRAGIPMHVVQNGNIKEDALRSQIGGRSKKPGTRWASMPYFTKSPTGSYGMIKRQCTAEYKINPIERFIKRELLGYQPRQRIREKVIQWRGISADEIRRLRASTVYWYDLEYPLVGIPREYLSKPLTRQDCKQWLKLYYPEREFVRSACIGCPFRSNACWQWLRDKAPADWMDAVNFDKAIRHCGDMYCEIYLHRQRVPLTDVDIDRKDQTDMFRDAECLGMCNV